MTGNLNKNEIENLLKEQVIGRIGCCADNNAYVVPVSYAYDGKYIYVRSFEGRKIEIMRKNPNVCFEVDNTRNMANWQSAIAKGEFEELTDITMRTTGLKILIDRHLPLISSETTHLGGTWPFFPKNLNNIEGIVFRIHLREKTGRFERNEAPLVEYIG